MYQVVIWYFSLLFNPVVHLQVKFFQMLVQFPESYKLEDRNQQEAWVPEVDDGLVPEYAQKDHSLHTNEDIRNHAR